MQHPDSPKKRPGGSGRRIMVPLTAVLVLAVLAFGILKYLDRPAADAGAIPLPAGEKPGYRVHLKYPGDGAALTVTEEIRWTNPEGSSLDRLCLRMDAAAYARDSTSPAAAADLYEKAYPDGFEAAEVTLEGCWVNEALTAAAFDGDTPNLLWLDAPAGPGETVEILLRYRLTVPGCASLFGRADSILRLIQALPTVARRVNSGWDTAPAASYGAPQDMEISEVAWTADLPAGYRLITGGGAATDQLAALIVREDMPQITVSGGTVPVRVLAGSRKRASAIANAARHIWPVLTRLYGRLPLDALTVVSLPLTDTGYSAPGLVLLDSGLTGDELEHRLAYWLAGQWFGWAVSTDNAREGWFNCAARQWAALRWIRESKGAGSEADMRTLWVELPMREDLHAAVTPGTPADGFPDQAAYRAVMDGRATAFLCALDTWLEGGVDSLLNGLIRDHAFGRIGRDTLQKAVFEATGRDVGPLMTDWLDTYMNEKP